MASKLINLRLNDSLLAKIDSIVRRGIYSSRTEFIKLTLIKSIEDAETARAIKKMEEGIGFGKKLGIKSMTQKEIRGTREATSKYLLNKYGLD